MKKLLLLLLPVLCGAEDLSNLNCSKEIRNVSFEASSFYQYSVGPHQANLRNQDGGGAWCPQSLIMKNSDTEEFLELVLEAEFLISKIRVLPFSFHSRTVCMRVGLKGCEYKGNLS